MKKQPKHNSYKIPIDIALEMINGFNSSCLKKEIFGAIKAYRKDHFVEGMRINPSSLEKRITGALKSYFARLLVDRLILDWLCTNRIDLSKIDGELRNSLIKIIRENK